jgi:hypothetical protein
VLRDSLLTYTIKEAQMRKTMIALSAATFALSTLIAVGSASAAPKTTKMGCIVGKQKYSATDGKCVAAKPVKAAAKATKK